METEMSSSYKRTHQMMVTRQVACRDFPHSRQHCAKFPFNSTPPERHCDLCHCYVCDSIAPCKYWGKGSSNYDHCHATEKEERWKLQRENRKQRKRAQPSAQFHHVSQINHCNPVPRHNNVQPSTVIRSTPCPVIQSQVSRHTVIRACTSSTSNPVMENQVSKPTVIRPCTPSPRVRGHTKSYMAQHISARNRNQHHLASQQPVRPKSKDFMRKERDQLQSGTCHGRNLSGTSNGNVFLNALPSQSQVQSQPFPQSVNQSLNGRGLTYPDSQSQGNPQQPAHDYFPLPGAVTESSSQLHASYDQTLPVFDFEKWLLDNETLQDDFGGPTDAGMLRKWLLGNDHVYD